MLKKLSIKLLTVLALVGAVCGLMALKKETVYCKTVAITQVVEHPALDRTYKGILDELAEQGYVPGKNMNLIYECAQGDPVIASQIAHKFAGLKPDVVVAIGTTSAQTMKVALEKTDIPLVFSSVTDPIGSQLVSSFDDSSVNVTGLSNWIEMGPQLDKFKKILPNLNNLGVIYNPGEANSVALIETLRKEAKTRGIRIITAAATNSSEVVQASQQIMAKVDGIFITNDNTALSAFEGIVKEANKAKKPVFVSDTDMVEKGAVAALGPNQYKLGKQTGEMVVQILGGAAAYTMAVALPDTSEFHINLEAVASIRLAIPDHTIVEADSLIPARG